MSKLIALKSGVFEILSDGLKNDFSKLKQEALMFDQIGILKLDKLFATGMEIINSHKNILVPGIATNIESVFSELEWLRQAGVVYELDIKQEFQVQETKDFIKKVSPQNFEELVILFNKVVEIQNSFSKKSNRKKNKAELNKEQEVAILRLMVIFMELEKGFTAVTTLPHTEYVSALPNSRKSEVAQIVIKNLPLPNKDTPWEQIIDYRNDTENQKHLSDLRRWIRKISLENFSSTEIEEEIEWLVNEFQAHMKLHNLKANTETLEVMIKVIPETIENIIKLNFSKLPDPLFAVKKVELNLMEAELNAPGREMAYIIKARDTFQSDE